MILRQTPNEEIVPVLSLQTIPVVTDPGGSSSEQHRDVLYTEVTNATAHNEYIVVPGADLPVVIASQSPANALDISEWPKVVRNPGVNAVVRASFSNSRATSSPWTFDMQTATGATRKLSAEGAEPDSYFEYSYLAVKAIADEMENNVMWDTSGNRAQTSVIPHQAFTGQVWNGGSGIPGTNPSGTVGGRRFMAITRRHLFGCGHYQYYPGEVLYWKDVNNNIISRTVLSVTNFETGMQAAGVLPYDMSIAVLNADLPESITILPVAGDWARGIVSVDADEFTYCQQVWGFALLNNDGHLNPFCIADLSDSTLSRSTTSYRGLTFDDYKVRGVAAHIAGNEMEDWGAEVGSPFYHVLRGGDSGSPCVVPCAEEVGWCFSGHLSRNQQPNKALFDQIIALADSDAGISTGYTVTEATDPTA